MSKNQRLRQLASEMPDCPALCDNGAPRTTIQIQILDGIQYRAHMVELMSKDVKNLEKILSETTVSNEATAEMALRLSSLKNSLENLDVHIKPSGKYKIHKTVLVKADHFKKLKDWDRRLGEEGIDVYRKLVDRILVAFKENEIPLKFN